MPQPNERLFAEIERLCRSGQPLPAGEHARYAARIAELRWDLPSSLVVGRRRGLQQRLASGALKTLIIDDTRESVAIVRPFMIPVLGSISVQIAAERPFAIHRRQRTTLTLDWFESGEVGAQLGGTVPFDDTMADETRGAWHELGMELHYGIEAGEGYYIFEPMGEFSDTAADTLSRIS